MYICIYVYVYTYCVCVYIYVCIYMRCFIFWNWNTRYCPHILLWHLPVANQNRYPGHYITAKWMKMGSSLRCDKRESASLHITACPFCGSNVMVKQLASWDQKLLQILGVQVVLTYLNSPWCVVNKCHVVSQCQLAESSRLPAKCSRIGVNSSIIINNKSWSIIFINNNHDLGSTPFSLKRKPSFPHCNWGYFLGSCLCPLKHPGTKLSKAILSRIVVTIVVTAVVTVNNDNNDINQWYIYI